MDSVSSVNAASEDLNAAVTGTELLDSSASKAKRLLASSGALAGRRPPSHLHQADSMVSATHCSRAFQFGQKKFRFDSILATEWIFLDSIRQSDKFATCTLIFK